MPTSGPSPALHQQLQHTAELLQQVRGGASLTDALARLPPALRPGCQALAFHVMRWRASAEAARRLLAPKAPAPALDALLTTALALLWPAGTPPYPDHTLVDEAVRCVKRRWPRSDGFVNAVLRNFLRRREELVQTILLSEEGRWNHPVWWVRRLQHDWGEQAEGILLAAQEHPPMTLRAHARRGGVARLSPALDDASIGWRPTPHPAGTGDLPQGVTLERPLPVGAIPGFAAGDWSVQDAAAQLAAPLLLQGLSPPDGRRLRVLDACAAPGGKTAHLLELAELDLTALDADASRLTRVADTLQRLSLSGPQVRVVAADAREPARWWNGQPFDAVLLDAPCSASGIVRRHPDARWLRREADISALAQVQAQLLDALWPLLRPGGHLLYATCSVFKAEGCEQVEAFLQRQGLPASIIQGQSPGHLLPLADNRRQAQGPDGFFYALLKKPDPA